MVEPSQKLLTRSTQYSKIPSILASNMSVVLKNANAYNYSLQVSSQKQISSTKRAGMKTLTMNEYHTWG